MGKKANEAKKIKNKHTTYIMIVELNKCLKLTNNYS